MLAGGRTVVVAARSAGRSQTALRVEEEHASGDDLFALPQALPDLHAVGELRTDDHRARLELIAGRHEDVLLQSRIDDPDVLSVLVGRALVALACGCSLALVAPQS